MIMPEVSLKDIPWESRNLSMPSFEVQGDILNKDTLKIILQEKKETLKENFFVQLRVKAERLEEVLNAEEVGFRFAEMVISPFLIIDYKDTELITSLRYKNESVLPKDIKKEFVNKEKSSVKDLETSLKESIIRTSKETYTADRFHMDPNCANSIADNRIGLWVEKDLFQDNQNMCTTVEYKEKLVGYIIWKESRFIIGGLSNQFIGKGLGKSLYIQSILDVVDNGSKEVSANISVNNIPVLNLYSRLGFSFREPTYLFHYWG